MRHDLEEGTAHDVEEPPAQNYVRHPEYDKLDDGIRASVSAKQFAWMPDSQRTRFMNTIGEPESFPDA